MEESCPLIPNLMKEHIEPLFIHAGRCDKQLLSVLDIMINQVTHLLNETISALKRNSPFFA